MTAEDEFRNCLLEKLNSSAVERLATDVLGSTDVDIAMVVTTSVLVPAAKRQTDIIPVRFYHRVFHEFFLARYLYRNKLNCDRFPTEVVEFCTELEGICT